MTLTCPDFFIMMTRHLMQEALVGIRFSGARKIANASSSYGASAVSRGQGVVSRSRNVSQTVI